MSQQRSKTLAKTQNADKRRPITNKQKQKLKGQAPKKKEVARQLNKQKKPLRAKARIAGPQLGSKEPYSSAVPHGMQSLGLNLPVEDDELSYSIQERLKKKSPWYQSILDPLHGADCKVPDETGVTTGTLQEVHKVQQNSTAAGVLGFRVRSPYCINTGATVYGYQVVNTGTSTASSINWSSSTEPASWSTLRSYADSVRVASMAIYVQSMASLATNQGIATGYVNAFPAANYADGSPVTTYQNLYKSSLLPLNTNEPLVVRWFPVDIGDRSFKTFYSPNNATWGAAAGTSNPYWEIGIILSGLDTGSVPYEFTVVINYEFIPISNSLNIIDSAPSPQDAEETDLVENWVQDMNISEQTTNEIVSSSPSTVTPAHEDDMTGFGMFFNVLTELLPIALAIL